MAVTLRGAFTAAVTPLRDAGGAVDEGALAPMVDFLAAGDMTGVLVAGTTGEGVAGRSGYTVPPAVVERLRERTPNLAGLKVSDAPWEPFEPYLLEGLDIFAGPEALIHRAIEQRAVKLVLRLRGVPVEPDVRRPLRLLDDAERAELEGRLAEILETTGQEREQGAA